jgi:amino acid permease
MMVALGEMSAMYPLSGSFAYYATRWLDPALGFALGYNYWFCWAMSRKVLLCIRWSTRVKLYLL